MALFTPLEPLNRDPERNDRDRERRPRRSRKWQLTTAWSPGDMIERRPPKALVVALVIAGISLVSIDHLAGDDSPLDPARSAVAEVVGPLESAATTVVRPVAGISDWFSTNASLRDDVASLEAENTQLRGEVAGAGVDQARLEGYDGLLSAAESHQMSLVPSRVIAYGPAQSFTRTVTIDAGSEAGLTEDMTVIAAEGLVGRVIEVSPSTATVLLIVDTESTVGARIGRSQEVGFLTGRGLIDSPSRLDLELVDTSAVPTEGEPVLTFGSDNGGPYRAGIPIGEVVDLFSTPRDTAQRAVIEPYVDFSTLDVVGVVVPDGTVGERGVIQPDGSIQ